MKQPPSRGGGKTHHVHWVLDHDGYARKRPQGLACGATLVDRAGIGESVGIEEDDRVVARVIAGDPIEAGLGQRLRREGAAGKAGLRLLDGELGEVDGAGGAEIVHGQKVPLDGLSTPVRAGRRPGRTSYLSRPGIATEAGKVGARLGRGRLYPR